MERALQDLLRNGRSRTYLRVHDEAGEHRRRRGDAVRHAPRAVLRIGGRRDGDVFVTNPLHRVPHPHRRLPAPPRAHLRRPAHRLRAAPVDVGVGMYVDVEMVSGALCVAMDVEGESLRLVLDTGAAAPVSVHKRSSRLRAPADGARRATQLGVNGERVCSQVHQGDVTFAGITQRNVDVLVSDSQPMGVDGYVGMAFLRAFDLLIAPRKLGVRASGPRSGAAPPQRARARRRPRAHDQKILKDARSPTRFSCTSRVRGDADLFKVARADRACASAGDRPGSAYRAPARQRAGAGGPWRRRSRGHDRSAGKARPRSRGDEDAAHTGEPSALINGGAMAPFCAATRRSSAWYIAASAGRWGWARPSRSVVEVNRNVRLLDCHHTMDHAPTSPVVSHAVTVALVRRSRRRAHVSSWNGPTLKSACRRDAHGGEISVALLLRLSPWRDGEFVGCTFNNEKMDGVALWDAARARFGAAASATAQGMGSP